jgi:hypothetical protein
MKSFDPVAAAISWFDAYRASSLAIVDLYSESALLDCNCTQTLVVGRGAITEYWRHRFIAKPAVDLKDVWPYENGVVMSYGVKDGVVRSNLAFDGTDKIQRARCLPALRPQERDRYNWDLQCPKCKSTGVADVSENAFPPELLFASTA